MNIKSLSQQASLHPDVLIIGGGPAGLCAAESAAKMGVRTVVLERQKEIGYPIHTSGGTWISDMVALGIPPSLYHPIRKVTFLSQHNSCDFTYAVPINCVLDIRSVYQYLAERAINAGAIVRTATPIEGPILENGRVIGVTGKNSSNEPQTWHAPVTIDATGYSSILATRAGLHTGYRRYGFGAEWDVYAPNYPQDELYLLVGGNIAPSGYAWAFPRGKGRVRLGVGVIRPDVDVDARMYLTSFIDRLPRLAPVFAGASPIEYHTGLFPSEGMMAHFVADGLMTIGDSAGHGSTLVGEGIRFAMHAGHMAGSIAAVAAKRGDTSAKILSEFDRSWRAKYGRNLDIALLLNHRIAGYTDQQWDESIDILRKLTPNQAAEALRGDFSMKFFMQIVRSNPELLGKGARAFANTILKAVEHKDTSETEQPSKSSITDISEE